MLTKYRVDFRVKYTWIEDLVFETMTEANIYGLQSSWEYRVVPVSVEK